MQWICSLVVCRAELEDSDPDENPLIWWPQHPMYGSLYPLAKMLLAIPATSADDERVFSSAGVTLSERRTRLDIDNFCREHRIRQFLTAGTSLNAQEGRRARSERADTLLRRFGDVMRERERQQRERAQREGGNNQ